MEQIEQLSEENTRLKEGINRSAERPKDSQPQPPLVRKKGTDKSGRGGGPNSPCRG